MRTFEQFIAEADELGLEARLSSGQIDSRQKKILADRRAARAKLPSQQSNARVNSSGNQKVNVGFNNSTDNKTSSALAIRSTNPTSSSSGNQNSSTQSRTTTTSASRPATSVAPKRPSFGQNVATQIRKRADRKFNQTLPDQIAKSVVNAPENVVKGAFKLGKNLLKKQEAPKLGITKSQNLSGPKVFGAATR